MAEKKQWFWSYFKDQVTDWLSRVKDAASSVVRWVTNVASGKKWSDNNKSIWDIITWKDSGSAVVWDTATVPQWGIKRQTTLNDVASWSQQATWPQVPDISQPKDLLWLNSLSWQEDIKMDDTPTLEQVAQWNEIRARDIIGKADIKSEEQVKQNEEKMENESWRDSVKSFWHSTKDFVGDIFNAPREYWQNKAVYQANEKKVAVWYDPESWDIMQLALNEWQGLFDDFNATVFKKGKWNSKKFSNLYQQYQQQLDTISSSGLDWNTKALLANEAFHNFKNEVEDKELIKVYANDVYSDWLFYPIFDSNSTWRWRMKDKFSQEQLDTLAKTDIKKWGIYKLTDNQFDEFIKAYEYNNELRNWIYGWDEWDDEDKILVELEDSAQSEAMDMQSKQVMNWVTQYLNAQADIWALTPPQRNDIENRVMNEVDSKINNMRVYMWWPLAYYRLVQSKDPGELTEWERAILWMGEWMLDFMDDYVSALQRWAEETVKTWIDEDWNLSKIPDTIDWMSVNDYFKEKTKDSNIRAWGVDLLANESTIDAMQLINQNINHLYRQWKGNPLRQFWTEAWYNLWMYWYTAAELWQMWVNWLIWWWIADTLWLDLPWWADQAQDYHRADWLTAYLVETDDTSILWSKDLWRLLKEYSLKWLDIAWETAWMLIAEKPFLWGTWSATRRTYKWLNMAKQATETAAKAERNVWTLWRLYNEAKTAIWNTRAAWWTRRFMENVSDMIAKHPKATAKTRAIVELAGDWIKRVANDQLIDLTSTYLDTESYSTPSFWLSMAFTWWLELLPALMWNTQLWKMVKNKARWLGALDWTWWKMIDYMTSDPEVMKGFERYFWTNNPTFKQLKVLGKEGWWSWFEDALKVMYNQLNPEAQKAMNNFSKKILINQVGNLSKVDWQSSYGKWLRAILDAQGTNWADIIKYIFWIPGKVDFGGFSSSILFKEWGNIQTRYIKQAYDTALDNIEWWFRRRLEQWFTDSDIIEIAQKNTKYKDLVKDWKVNKSLFELGEDWKYVLNEDWAKYLGLDVSNYTEAMARQDVLKKQAKETRELLDEKIQKLAVNKWISEETIKKVVDSWAFNRMVDEFQRVLC